MPHSVVILSADLFFSSQIDGALREFDVTFAIARNFGQARQLSEAATIEILILDLTHRDLGDLAGAIRLLRAGPHPPQKLVAYAQHVHPDRLKSARRAGCDLVTTRSEIVDKLCQVLEGA